MPVPQELVDLIVDDLKGDVASLKSCCLAARTFVQPSQTHIFRKVEFFPPTSHKSGDDPCQKFHKAITSSPHLAALVDELCIVLSFPHKSAMKRPESHAPWGRSRTALSLILPLLNLKRISLVERSSADWMGGQFGMNWMHLNRSLRSALTTVFSSPTLESVRLCGLVVRSPRELFSFFSEAASLKSLSISRIYFDQPSVQLDLWPESQPWYPKLSSLLVCDMKGDPLCSYFSNTRIDLSHVTSLSVESVGPEEILDASLFNRIEHLSICNRNSVNFHSILTSSLRTLCITTDNIGTTMLATFRACPSDSRLETIAFEGSISRYGLDMPMNDTIESALDRMSSLKAVRIRVDDSDYADDPGQLVERLVSLVPSLVERGLLEVSEF